MKRIDLTGKRFGRLVVSFWCGKNKWGHVRWLCKCDCGSKILVTSSHLSSGNTKSCGCLLKDFKVTHGMTSSDTYTTWEKMKGRCKNPNDDRYKDYGGRGIEVCEKWDKFEGFLEDMGERPAGTTIDRVDNDGNYEKKNCIWATPKEQGRNTRSNRMIRYRGEVKCVSAWAESLGMNHSTLRKRIDRGFGITRAFNERVANVRL